MILIPMSPTKSINHDAIKVPITAIGMATILAALATLLSACPDFECARLLPEATMKIMVREPRTASKICQPNI